ncbi:MAG: hypothetical protein CMJ50_09420 [Planctomycetaceae bacterium]|nr:hypothetical protein [Planctomycetaceae bacterium]
MTTSIILKSQLRQNAMRFVTEPRFVAHLTKRLPQHRFSGVSKRCHLQRYQLLVDSTPMTRFLHPILLLVARATESELGRYVEYLKAENRILRDKLPKRISVTPAERDRLVKQGLRVGPAIKELIAIVTPWYL